VIIQAFGEESRNRMQVFKWHARFRADQKKGKTGKEQEHVHIFFAIKATVHKEFILAVQSVTHTTVTFCSNCVEVCENFAPNFGDKGSSSCITTTHHLSQIFHPEIFYQKHNCRPPLTLLASLGPL
jgi:hypothetical protein